MLSTNFTINKNQSLFNGFFNRIAVAEVVLDWDVPNIDEYWKNNTITIKNAVTNVEFEVDIVDGFYKVVDLLEYIVDNVNTQAAGAGDPLDLEVAFDNTGIYVGTNSDDFQFLSTNPLSPNPTENTNLVNILIPADEQDITQPLFYIQGPVLLGTRYIDIVCQQLTYNQELKDNTTAQYNRDVLYRWYFAYDNVPTIFDKIVDEINPGDVGPPFIPPTYALVDTTIPILQGYNNFVARRTPPVAKQIRWSPEQPIGQVNFQVYDDQGRLLDLSAFESYARMDFQMSLLLSED